MNLNILGVLLLIGGTWVFQDSYASIMYYLKTNENWYYNQQMRLWRLAWGLVLIGLGVWVIIGG